VPICYSVAYFYVMVVRLHWTWMVIIAFLRIVLGRPGVQCSRVELGVSVGVSTEDLCPGSDSYLTYINP